MQYGEDEEPKEVSASLLWGMIYLCGADIVAQPQDLDEGDFAEME